MTLRAQNERRKSLVFCIDYIEKIDNFIPLCFSGPNSILILSCQYYYFSKNI